MIVNTKANTTEQQQKQQADAIIKRMMQAFGVEQLQQLGVLVSGHARSVSNWKTRGAVPFAAVYSCHLKTGASLDWLYHGIAPSMEATEAVKAAFNQQMFSLITAWQRIGFVKSCDTERLKQEANALTEEALAFFSYQSHQE